MKTTPAAPGVRGAWAAAQRVASGMTIGASELRDYLAGLEYPVSRADLVRWGQENGVSTETLQLLHELPAESFDSPADLTEALGSLA